MDSASGPTEPVAPRPTRPLSQPGPAVTPSTERKAGGSDGSPDLGGTLISHAPDPLAELSSDSEDEDGVAPGSKRRKGKSKYNAPRRQIKIEYIQDKSRRNITFGKRKNGIFKKAQEISTLTGCEVMLIVAPKDSELQAYTYATARLQPLVSDPAGETYIQNCLRYGALMPGPSSTVASQYGMGGSSNSNSHFSGLRPALRGSPAPNPAAMPYNPLYSSYLDNNGVPRRTKSSYTMPHPLSLSPQSSPSTNVTSTHTPQSVTSSDQAKREASHSPIQHLGVSYRNHSSKTQQWTPGPPPPTGEFSPGPAASAPNSSIGSSCREIPPDWVVNPRTLFPSSSPLGATSISARGISSFPLTTSGPASGNTVSHLAPDGNPFHRNSSEGSIMASSNWPPLSQSSPGIRTAPLGAAHNISGTAIPNNEAGFLEPLVLSQPFDPRSINCGEEQLSAGTNYTNRASPVNFQPPLAQYSESENFERVGRSLAYVNGDGSENENWPHVLEGPNQNWTTGLH